MLKKYRILVHYVYAALIAVLFPETLSRMVKFTTNLIQCVLCMCLLKFPGEVLVYWVQHIMIFFVVPPFLIYSWGMKRLIGNCCSHFIFNFRPILLGAIWWVGMVLFFWSPIWYSSPFCIATTCYCELIVSAVLMYTHIIIYFDAGDRSKFELYSLSCCSRSVPWAPLPYHSSISSSCLSANFGEDLLSYHQAHSEVCN